jgi:hypothetical protein
LILKIIIVNKYKYHTIYFRCIIIKTISKLKLKFFKQTPITEQIVSMIKLKQNKNIFIAVIFDRIKIIKDAEKNTKSKILNWRRQNLQLNTKIC